MLESVEIPKCCRQPRSIRTHTCRSSLPRKGSIIEVSSSIDRSSSSSTNSMDKGSDGPVSRHGEGMPEFSLFPCSTLWKGEEEGNILNSFEVPVTEVESVPTNESPNSCKNRNIGSYSIDHVRTSEVPLPTTPDSSRSPTSGNADSWLTPGSVVWAKAFYDDWWPAEVVDEKVVRECTGSRRAGHVLVQLFGNHQHSWLDLVDLSQFDHCYEERSRNPMIAFQDALKQALCKHLRTCPTLQWGGCSGEMKSSTSHEHSLDEWNTPSSNGTKDDCITENDHNEGGRGRRKRKLKFHFDELTFQEKPTRRLRRLRIMRNLGLIAPVGSPFSLTREK